MEELVVLSSQYWNQTRKLEEEVSDNTQKEEEGELL